MICHLLTEPFVRSLIMRRTTATSVTVPGVSTKFIASETGDNNGPHLIPYVCTTDATKTDIECIEEIHQALAGHKILPHIHVLDAG
jgi:hypothetical protein